MTTSAIHLPTDVTQMPAGLVRVTVDPLHLSITQEWASGDSNNIHLLENGDLGVILKRGSKSDSSRGIESGQTGTLVISLGVDEDHDEVHYEGRNAFTSEELLSQAIEVLLTARQAIRRTTDAQD